MYYIDYDPFVLPFTLGVLALLVMLFWKFFQWWDKLQPEDRIVIRTGLRSGKLLSILKEVFLESLIHRSMWKQNPVQGYMHMTFAFGWFMLILIGNLESRIHSGVEFNMPYYPIFFKFFLDSDEGLPFSRSFTFIMDFFLLLVLSGLLLAMFKRVNAKLYGMKKPVKPEAVDRIALTALWFIFPLRLLAESFSSAMTGTGGFLTGNLGEFLSGWLPARLLAYPAWWSYSIALSVFFVCMPFSRYMHIPAEVLLIYLRHLGFKPTKTYDFFSVVEVHSCPSCGVCVESCQLKSSLGHGNIVPAYFLRGIKNDREDMQAVSECLLCGRCQQVCPVRIHVNDIRIQRRELLNKQASFSYTYLPSPDHQKADVVYFAGCMTHLTPGIKRSMEKILQLAGVKYLFLDKEGGICCGRPLQIAGLRESAMQLVDSNRRLIRQSGAGMLLTSCPICLKVFREEYDLHIPVMHHSQYLEQLIESERISVAFSGREVSYHDPCELGRGCGIFEEPRRLVSRIAGLQEITSSRGKSLCCGGSMGGLSLTSAERKQLASDALEQLLAGQPDLLLTACPLCKKTFQPLSPVGVMDIAEFLISAMEQNVNNDYQTVEIKNNQTVAVL